MERVMRWTSHIATFYTELVCCGCGGHCWFLSWAWSHHLPEKRILHGRNPQDFGWYYL